MFVDIATGFRYLLSAGKSVGNLNTRRSEFTQELHNRTKVLQRSYKITLALVKNYAKITQFHSKRLRGKVGGGRKEQRRMTENTPLTPLPHTPAAGVGPPGPHSGTCDACGHGVAASLCVECNFYLCLNDSTKHSAAIRSHSILLMSVTFIFSLTTSHS